jgi:hypothetical protein
MVESNHLFVPQNFEPVIDICSSCSLKLDVVGLASRPQRRG